MLVIVHKDCNYYCVVLVVGDCDVLFEKVGSTYLLSTFFAVRNKNGSQVSPLQSQSKSKKDNLPHTSNTTLQKSQEKDITFSIKVKLKSSKRKWQNIKRIMPLVDAIIEGL